MSILFGRVIPFYLRLIYAGGLPDSTEIASTFPVACGGEFQFRAGPSGMRDG
jgi:hypothetical protein